MRPRKATFPARYIRPYEPPKEESVTDQRLQSIESQLGEDRHFFEYSLPRNTKIILTIIARHNGVIDREKSGIFHIMQYAEKDHVEGTFSIDRIYPQPLYNPQADPSWYISLSNYSYGIFERTPKNWMCSASSEENTVQGKSALKDARLFAFIPNDRKFTLVINARFAPAPSYQNISNTKRYPLPLSMK